MNHLNNRKHRAIALTVVLLAIFIAFLLAYNSEPDLDYPLTRVIRYSFTVHNVTSQHLQGEEFWAYAPVKQTSFQLSQNINVSHPYVLDTDKQGNQRLRFKLNLPPYGTKVISVEAKLALSEAANDFHQEQIDEYFTSQKYIEADNDKIITLAGQFSGNSNIESLNRTYSWVAQNVKYAGFIKDDRGALYALTNKQGDCTEYMYLFTALARAQGVPARAMGGFVVAEDAALKARDFHNWAEVYVDGKWRVIDPQHKVFMDKENQYVAMRIISGQINKSESLSLTSHGLFGSSKKLKIAMD